MSCNVLHFHIFNLLLTFCKLKFHIVTFAHTAVTDLNLFFVSVSAKTICALRNQRPASQPKRFIQMRISLMSLLPTGIESGALLNRTRDTAAKRSRHGGARCINAPASHAQDALNSESFGEPTFLDVPQGLRGTHVQFFPHAWLQFSLSNGVKHVSALSS